MIEKAFLTDLEEKGKLKAIITQNIDGLHTKANSKNVLELHGSIYRNYCKPTIYPTANDSKRLQSTTNV